MHVQVDKITLQKIAEAISAPVMNLIEIKAAWINEYDLDLKSIYMNMFVDEFQKLDTTHLRNLHKFNIMSMVGGPYYVPKETSIEVTNKLGSWLQVCIGNEYAGSISFLSDQCGIDNLLIMAGLSTHAAKLDDSWISFTNHGDKVYPTRFSDIKREIYGYHI